MNLSLDIISPAEALTRSPWFIPGAIILVVAVVAVAILIQKKKK